MTPTPQQATAAAAEVFGRHPGYRALHAKGVLLAGTFTATPEAAALTKAGHMQGEPVKVTARFSNGGGNPEHPDYAPDVRGFAVKFYLADGSRTDIVAQTSPLFPVSTPEAFLQLLHASKRPDALWRMPLFLARHPRAAPRFARALPALKPPDSYATLNYYAVHAFNWLDAGGGSRYVRYTLLPQDGDRRIGGKEAKSRGRDYLVTEIVERAARGAVRFDLQVQIAEPGDRSDDPSIDWPAERRRVKVGTIDLTGPDTEREQGDDVLVFDPTRVVDGIELSDDPVLRYRKPAYDASVTQRTAG